jgi:hypothetical protein
MFVKTGSGADWPKANKKRDLFDCPPDAHSRLVKNEDKNWAYVVRKVASVKRESSARINLLSQPKNQHRKLSPEKAQQKRNSS